MSHLAGQGSLPATKTAFPFLPLHPAISTVAGCYRWPRSSGHSLKRFCSIGHLVYLASVRHYYAHFLNCLSHSVSYAPPPRKSPSGWSYGGACSGCCGRQSACPRPPTACPRRSCPAMSSCPSARRVCNNPKILQSFWGEELTTWRVKTIEDEDDDQEHVDSSHLILYMC